MDKIYILGYNSGSYDDYCEANVKAFARKEDAEAYEKVCIAVDEHYVQTASQAQDAFLEGWYGKNRTPSYEHYCPENAQKNQEIMKDWYAEAAREYVKCLIDAGASEAEALAWTSNGTSPCFHFSWDDRTYTIEELEFQDE